MNQTPYWQDELLGNPQSMSVQLKNSGELHEWLRQHRCGSSKHTSLGVLLLENGVITLEDRAENLLSNEDVKRAYLGM